MTLPVPDVPEPYRARHPEPGRFYPTARRTGTVPVVGVNTGYTTYLAEGGYPDTSEAALAWAAGQRAAARREENRGVLTGRYDYTADDLMAPPGGGPTQPGVAVPDDGG